MLHKAGLNPSRKRVLSVKSWLRSQQGTMCNTVVQPLQKADSPLASQFLSHHHGNDCSRVLWAPSWVSFLSHLEHPAFLLATLRVMMMFITIICRCRTFPAGNAQGGLP